MATYKNPNVAGPKATPCKAGELCVIPEVFDFADTTYRPAAIAANDLIQIGVVPAGNKLVPHLCSVAIPAMDSGSPTGDYSLGSANDPDALKGSAASETAVTLSGEDFLLATGALGAKDVDVPIYITAIAASATPPTTGKVVCNFAIRAFDSAVDVDVT